MANRYEIMDLLATGGMAEIYRAHRIGAGGFQKPVVVKKILPSYTRDPEFVSMFVEEAKLAAQLHHGNIVQVYDLGRAGAGEFFIVMELVHGHDLGDLLHDAGRQGLVLGSGEAIFIARQVCAGLDYAHRKLGADGESLGIIHRDISPQNVLISFEGEVKLTDFGIAKARTRTQDTQVGFLKGKYGYMSPEQARGEPLDQRSDLFNVGILLYEMLAGERLFQGSNDFSTLNQMRNVEMVPLERLREGLPEALVALVVRTLSPDPEGRFESAAALDKALARLAFERSLTLTGADLSLFMEQVYGRPALAPGKLTATRVIDLEGLPGVAALRAASAEGQGDEANSPVPRSRPQTVSIQPARSPPLPPKEPTGLARIVPPLPPWVRGGVTLLLVVVAFGVGLALTALWRRDARAQKLPVGRLAAPPLASANVEPRWLLVRARPLDVMVIVDGEQRARATPVLLDLPPGEAEHVLRLEHKTHRAWRGGVALPEDEGVSEVDVQLTSRVYTVSVRTKPARAALLLDGKAVGRSPRTLKVGPGSHQLIARRRDRLSVTAEIEAGRTRHLDLLLPRRGETGRLKVLTYPAAMVRVGPRVLESGAKGVDLRLPTGSYRLELVTPGLPEQVLQVEIERSQTTQIFVDLMLSSPRP